MPGYPMGRHQTLSSGQPWSPLATCLGPAFAPPWIVRSPPRRDETRRWRHSSASLGPPLATCLGPALAPLGSSGGLLGPALAPLGNLPRASLGPLLDRQEPPSTRRNETSMMGRHCFHGSAALPPSGSASTALSPWPCGPAPTRLCLHGPVSTALRLCLHAALPPRPCLHGSAALPPPGSASAALSPRLYGSASTRLCPHGPASTALGALFGTYKSPLAGHKPPRRRQPPWRAKTPLGGHQPWALLGSSPDRPWSPLCAQ